MVLYRGGQFYWWGKPEYPEKKKKKTSEGHNNFDWLYNIYI